MSVTPSLTALQVMQDAPVIPVIVLHDVAHAVPMARALVAGGVRMLEVTLRTPQALACMEAIARDVPEAVVRPVAFVVAPGLGTAQIVQALRGHLESVFLPRRVLHVDALPREATGKLTLQTLRLFALEQLGKAGRT